MVSEHAIKFSLIQFLNFTFGKHGGIIIFEVWVPEDPECSLTPLTWFTAQ